MDIRRIKILLYVTILFLIPSFSNIYGATLSKPANNLGLVGYWSFNDATSTVATDFSGRGNTGTLNSFSAPATASSGWGSGKFGPGLNFDGTSDYVSINGVANDIVETSFAVSLWLKCADHGGVDRDLVASSHSGGGANFELYISSANLFSIWDGSQGASEITSSISGCDSRWHHAVYSRSGATGTLYVDGISQGTHSSSDVFAVDDLWSIGQTYASLIPDFFFQGTIDDVRIYSRPLSGTEVLNLYNSGSARINSSQNNLVTNGLLGMWSFDSRDMTSSIAYDRSGSANNGTLVGATRTLGKIGQALSFDGINDYVTTTDIDFATGGWTLSAWIKTTTSGSLTRVLSKGQNGAGTPQLWFLVELDGTMSMGWYTSSPFEDISAVSAVPVNDGNWHHVVAVVGATTIQMYVDGVASGSPASHDGTPVTNNDPWLIGSLQGTLEFFNGKIDEVRIYNRDISASEIKTLYNAGESKINASQNSIGGSSLNNGLVGIWSFNSKDLSDKVYDRSGNGHDGYFIGGATSSAKKIGKVGQAINFDGVNDSVLVAHSSLLDLDMTETATFSFWINKTSASATAGPIYKRTSGSPGYSIDILTTGAVSFSIGDLFSNNNRVGYETSSTMNLNQWYHVVVTYDGSITSTGIKIYFDGVLQPMTNAFDNYGGGSSSNGFDFSLGARETGTARLLDGKMDEVRMYNRVLSDSEIKQLYLLGK